MRLDKFTLKSQELIQNAESLASQQTHQQIEPEHLLSVMLREPEGVARAILLNWASLRIVFPRRSPFLLKNSRK